MEAGTRRLLPVICLVLAGCWGSRGTRVPAPVQGPVAEQYLAIFCQPVEGAVGVGFGPFGYYTKGEGHRRATVMACRLLAWSTRVRVKGERLFERLPDGQYQFGGESFELLEVPDLTPESCHLDTVEVSHYGWVIAASSALEVPGGVASFPLAQPAWVSSLPATPGWLHAVGMARLSIKDEAGSWEEATYEALIELARSAGSRGGDLEVTAADVARGANVLSVDTVVEGFRVAGRWRDREHAYVLGRVPVSGAVSHLSAGPAERQGPPAP